MLIKLRDLNGSSYMLVNQTLKALLNIKNEVNITIDGKKIIIEAYNEIDDEKES